MTGFGLLTWVLEGPGRGGRARVGAGFGLGVFAPALAWMAAFSLPGYLRAVLVEAAIVGGAVAAIAPGAVGLGVPAALVLAEGVRTRWPLRGMPLAGPVLGQVGGPFAEVAAWLGPLGVLAAAAGAGTAGGCLLASRGRTWRPWAAMALVGVAAAAPAGPGITAGPELDVAVVQGGGPRGVPAVRADATKVLGRHVRATRWVPADAGLVLWPEGVVEVDAPLATTRQGAILAALARDHQATMIVGVVETIGVARFRNLAVSVGPDGRVLGRYQKTHRVPFGEYVPARRLVDRIADLSRVPRDAIPGRGPGLLATHLGAVGVVVSFEVLFPTHARAAVAAGAQLLVVPTNAASFTDDQVPAEELAAARLRALEAGRPLLQAAPTGYSAVITPDGAVRGHSRLQTAAVLTATITRYTGRTPYQHLGEAPMLLAAAAVLIHWWRAHREGARRAPVLTGAGAPAPTCERYDSPYLICWGDLPPSEGVYSWIPRC